MRTIGNAVSEGHLRRSPGRCRRSGIDGCQPGCCTLVLHGFRLRSTRDPSLVSYRHLVGYRRSPGNLASGVTRSIGECRMPLWSTMVVSIQAHGSGGSYPTASLPAQALDCMGRWSTPGPQILNLGLSAWELACHVSLTIVFAAQRLFSFSVSARHRPSQTVPTGTPALTADPWLPYSFAHERSSSSISLVHG
jgi:hypothetical protein